jgi:hypothetical protein
VIGIAGDECDVIDGGISSLENAEQDLDVRRCVDRLFASNAIPSPKNRPKPRRLKRRSENRCVPASVRTDEHGVFQPTSRPGQKLKKAPRVRTPPDIAGKVLSTCEQVAEVHGREADRF